MSARLGFGSSIIAGALLVTVLMCGTSAAGATLAAPSVQTAADTHALKPAVRLHPPTAAPVPNKSTCRTGASQATMTITIPDVAYSCPVYSGGQSSIDAGFVTLVTDRGTSPTLALHPGDPGTLWVAAHRASHGGAFAAVPSLVDGAVVVVSDGTTTARYQVVGRVRVEVRNGRVVDAAGHATPEATVDSIIRPDRSGNLAPRLLLQTCDGENHRWMIYADLVSPTDG